VREGRRLARLADTLAVVGIGGSALGALALQTAL
jgi:glucose-6-phosphate isomerase